MLRIRGGIYMLGAIVGDIVGSRYEFDNHRSREFELFDEDCTFTDDTVMTIAVANALVEYDKAKDIDAFKVKLVSEMKRLGRKYPDRGYGGRFGAWLRAKDSEPYGSFGNGSAMRVSPVGFYADCIEEVMELAKASAEVTHNHPEGIKGAQATAAAIFLAKDGWDKEQIKSFIESRFYKLDFSIDELSPVYRFDETCQGSVPQALQCFFEGEDFESVIRNTIFLGGDCDTTGAIAGGVAEAYYGIPKEIADEAMEYLQPIAGDIEGWWSGSER